MVHSPLGCPVSEQGQLQGRVLVNCLRTEHDSRIASLWPFRNMFHLDLACLNSCFSSVSAASLSSSCLLHHHLQLPFLLIPLPGMCFDLQVLSSIGTLATTFNTVHVDSVPSVHPFQVLSSGKGIL